MNETLKATLDMMRALSRAANIKIHRGFTDFVADRVIIAATEPTLLKMIERFAGLLNSEIEYIGGKTTATFMRRINATDVQGVLDWVREYPRVIAMVVTLKDDEDFSSSLETIEVKGDTTDKGTALPAASYDIPIHITCLSLLSHGADTKAGNATIFRRMQVISATGQILTLPFYAGNAIRGQMRDLLADHFLAALGLIPRRDDPPCNLWFFHALYAGGALEENSQQAKALAKKLGSSGAIRTEGIHEFRNMIPPLSILGTALGNRIISGRINMCDFRPQCVEWGTGDIPVGNLFEWAYLTRREDHEGHEEGKNVSMIVNTECLKAGTVLDGGMDISEHTTEVERACIGMGLKLLQDTGYIGAENRRGLGQVDIEIENAPDYEAYEVFLREKRLEILTYLEEIGAINASGKFNFDGDN